MRGAWSPARVRGPFFGQISTNNCVKIFQTLGKKVRQLETGGWKQMGKIIRKYSKNSFSAEIIFEYLAFCEKHLSNKIEDRCKNCLDRIKDNFILSCGHV